MCTECYGAENVPTRARTPHKNGDSKRRAAQKEMPFNYAMGLSLWALRTHLHISVRRSLHTTRQTILKFVKFTCEYPECGRSSYYLLVCVHTPNTAPKIEYYDCVDSLWACSPCVWVGAHMAIAQTISNQIVRRNENRKRVRRAQYRTNRSRGDFYLRNHLWNEKYGSTISAQVEKKVEQKKSDWFYRSAHRAHRTYLPIESQRGNQCDTWISA